MTGVALTGDELEVLWHEIECGDYRADLPLWRDLARRARGPVLDIGAGTGRVTIDIARRVEADVMALDIAPTLLRRLEHRALVGRVDVPTLVGDASDFTIGGARFTLVIVPMQTVQLLDGPAARAGFLRSVRAVLAQGGLLAVAVADGREAIADGHTEPPLPDMREVDGVVYSSHAVAVRDLGDRVAIERIRQIVDGAGNRSVEGDVVELHDLPAEQLEAEAVEHGFAVEASRRVEATDEYVGSRVVMLRG